MILAKQLTSNYQMSLIHTKELMNKFNLYGSLLHTWKVDNKCYSEALCQDFCIASLMCVKPLVFWWLWKLINSLRQSLTCIFVEILILLSITLCWSYDGDWWDYWRHGTLSKSLRERQFKFILKLKPIVHFFH